MKERFNRIVKTIIKRDGIDNLLNWLETTDFYVAPASSREDFHGCFEGGLLQHSVDVYDYLIDSKYIDRNIYSHESIAIVSLFHDLCKIGIYKKDIKNVKENGVWIQKECYKYKEEFPFGHGEKSVYLINKFIRLTDEEAIAINWHMGGYDLRVKAGSYDQGLAYKMSPLALELHLADMRSTFLKK